MVAMTTRLCESSLRSAEFSGGEVEVSEEMDACWTLLCFALSATPTNGWSFLLMLSLILSLFQHRYVINGIGDRVRHV